jgi:exodeoxyribonuclease V alpha subunit
MALAKLDELVLAYATTIHKSQGSEYPAVVIPLTIQHYPMLQRNLVYTGVTRGKRLVVLVGQRKALAIVVKGAQTRRRWSKLRDWLIDDETAWVSGLNHRSAYSENASQS